MATAKILDFPLSTQPPTIEAKGFEIACETRQSQPFRMRTTGARIVISQYIRDTSLKLWESVSISCNDDGQRLTVRVLLAFPDGLKPVEISLISNPDVNAELPIMCHIKPRTFSGEV